jgi:thioredoxin 2
MHIVCPHCHATNRVPNDKLEHEINCGKCHRPVFDGHPANVSGSQLAAQIRNSDIPVVVDFWAAWCGPCRAMAPEFEKAAQMMEPHARFLKLDSDQEQSASMQYNIRTIPTLIVFKGGKEVARTSGARSATQLVQWVQSV